MIMPSHNEIKKPLVFLENEALEGRIVWFENQNSSSEEKIICFDDIPGNYPRWVLTSFKDYMEAKESLDMLIKEGWEITQKDEGSFEKIFSKKQEAETDVRQEIIDYMEENEDGMAESHLGCWFTSKYQGKSKSECENLIENEHDDSLEKEELEEHFPDITEEEIEYCINKFHKAVIKNLVFEGAACWIDTCGDENYK